MKLFRLAALLLFLPGAALAFDFSFALFGDTPYTDEERERLPAMIDAMAREGNEFAVHDGDIKSGDSLCRDEVYQDRLKLFQASAIPIVFLPGDNEWTDCHRLFTGLYKPEERLRHLRQVFYPDDQTLGQKKFRLERQSDVDKRFTDYRENVRWNRGRVLFVGLNIPGSANNYGDKDTPSAEFLAREKANRNWLDEAFDLAHKERHAVVFVIIQANPDFAAFKDGRQNLGFQAFLHQIQAHTAGFPGRVILVHGDTHRAHIDQPLRHPVTRLTMRNFLRVETFGSPHMGWTRVRVLNADTSPKILFDPRPWWSAGGLPPLINR